VISRLTGRLVEKHPPTIVVDVHGVGYELDVPMSTLYQLPATGQDVKLYTHLLVREDAHLLYGFASEPERQMFRQLLKITGIGARIALAVLSGMSVDEIHAAVGQQDGARLTKIPGIGKKTAERLLLELKDKLAVLPGASPAGPGAGTTGSDALHALLALGYAERDARAALAKVDAAAPLQETIRQALRLLSKV
jgi:Holliday junction DNA helicase RuvA